MNRQRTYQWIAISTASLVIAVLSHLFFLTEFFKGRYMTGLNDGLSQMIPFKYFLYQLYTNGEFFYSESFGLGGGVFSQLGYYFSTSLVFLVTVLVTFLLEKAGAISTPDLFYWANTLIVISILRMTCIIAFSTYYFKTIRFQGIPAFLGAVLYGTSVIYFRHVTYWEFFADAMLFFPLLLIGIEKIMQNGKSTIFIVAVALNMIDNFYFAYVNFLLTFLYILFRWLFPLLNEELEKGKQVKRFLVAGIAGAGISAPFFIPSVYGYLNNFRPTYEDAVPLVGAVDNLLLHGRIVILPAFVLLCLLMIPLYKNRAFRFFAASTIMLCILHYSPFIGSVFNGFSAPQYRWEHYLSLAAGGTAAAALQQLRTLRLKDVILSAIVASGLYMLFYTFDPKLKIQLHESYLLICAGVMIALFFVFIWNKKRWTTWLIITFILFTTVLTANMFQEEKLTYRDNGKNKGPAYGITREYMESEQYYGVDQRAIIRTVQTTEKDPLARIDWMIETRNNTPIVQDFNGMSVYSSILNKHLLFFYLQDLHIDMRRESVSRYGSLGDRANLYSILNGGYVIRKEGGDPVPFGFTEISREGEYLAYKNDYLLPFARTTSTVYAEEDLEKAHALVKEHAMLKGIILSDGKGEEIPELVNIVDDVTFEPVNATYEDGVLHVADGEGGLDVGMGETDLKEDSFLSFFIQRKTNNKAFDLKVNGFTTERKENGSIYRTNINDLTIRVPSKERISIRVPKGKYELRDFSLYTEDYSLLASIKEQSDRKALIDVSWSGSKAKVELDNQEGDSHLILPIPYEKGWTAKVNGEKTPILQANYAFTGIELKNGKNEIELKYYPPYFWPSLGISLLSILFSVYWIRRKEKTASSSRSG